MARLIDWLRALTPPQAAGLLLLENLLVFGFAIGLGHLLVLIHRDRRIGDPPPPLSRTEAGLAALTIALNTTITLAGWLLWRAGIIEFRTDTGWRAWLDVLILLLAMDLAMYLLHRVAHARWIYPIAHRTHHRFEHPRPLTLFALNPFETLSFGVLWLAVIAAADFSWLGMSVYLLLNVLFGMIGHLGVEPLPARWARLPVLRHLGTSTFHAGHHYDPHHNFGFYTLIWDRLFGTLARHEAPTAAPIGRGEARVVAAQSTS